MCGFGPKGFNFARRLNFCPEVVAHILIALQRAVKLQSTLIHLSQNLNKGNAPHGLTRVPRTFSE
jgi:hypothetical protein